MYSYCISIHTMSAFGEEQCLAIQNDVSDNVNSVKNICEKMKNLKEADTEAKIEKILKRPRVIYHPDHMLNSNCKQDAEEKFKQINESYKLLLKKFMKKND